MNPRLLFALFAATIAAASVSAQSSVWKVTRNGHSIFVGGTCHMLRASDLPIPAEFETAFEAADILFFETDIARMQSPEAQQLLMAGAMFTDGSTLSTALSPEAWKSVQDYCAKAGIPMQQIQSLKPWMITIMIAMVEFQRLGFLPEGVDVQLHRKGKAAGKMLDGLESLEDHIAIITALGAGHESDLVLSTLRDLGRIPGLLEEIIAAWRSGDLEKLDTLMSVELRQDFPQVYDEMLVKRNRAWLPKIEAMLSTDPQEFVLVGVAHLAGEDGIIHALEQKGCTIEQINAAR